MKNELPLVCICIPCFNAEKTISETLGSIRNQSYPNIEIHIFDNASTDKTVEIIKAVSDDRIHFHLAGYPGTAESNFTRCLNLGRGDYTAIFHADDLYAPDMVEKEVGFLESSGDAAGVLTFAKQIDASGAIIKTSLAPPSLKLQKGEGGSVDLLTLFKAILEHGNFLFCPSAMIRTKICINEIKAWRGDKFKSSADLDLWFRLAAYSHLGLLNEPLLYYRISDAQFTADYSKKRVGRADMFLVLDHWLQKGAVKNAISEKDMKKYRKLQRRDAFGRVLNALRTDDIQLAKEICSNEISSSVVIELFQIRSVKDLKLFIFACMLKLMLLPVIGCGFKVIFLNRLGKARL